MRVDRREVYVQTHQAIPVVQPFKTGRTIGRNIRKKRKSHLSTIDPSKHFSIIKLIYDFKQILSFRQTSPDRQPVPGEKTADVSAVQSRNSATKPPVSADVKEFLSQVVEKYGGMNPVLIPPGGSNRTTIHQIQLKNKTKQPPKYKVSKVCIVFPVEEELMLKCQF